MESKNCLFCNKLFVPNPKAKVKAVYCSNYCRTTSWEKRNPEKYKRQIKLYRQKVLSNPVLHERDKASQRKHSHSFKGRYTQIKSQAKTRNYAWDLTKEQFSQFWNKSCHYCGELINGVGIDRIDNSKGYYLENCVPCCQTCNVMKNGMTVEQFKKKCTKILANLII